MGVNETYLDGVRRIVADDSRYPPEAYFFIQEAVTYTAEQLERRGNDGNQHITGKELLDGIRQHALSEFGPMARLVFDEWGIHCTEDFGNIVFSMVSHNLLGASDEDTISDFRDIYDFEKAFVEEFLPGNEDVDIPTIG
ncbi:MAG: hypothetical protein QGF67_04915 [Lentisphaeria bacterium]|jgi:uncharacterized repeat protein (TIGR04138 family)|nr:hypothetical protein [Lentisphaeria bacterium]MDP7740757.1 hypothetical protein [Lentisphaeria bacterium]